MKIPKIGSAVILFGTLLFTVCDSHAETIVLRSGNGSIGGNDSQVNMLPGPSDSAFSTAFTSTDFANAKSGSAAFIISSHSFWVSGLAGDAVSQWISTNSSGYSEGGTALYAINFNLSDPIGSATLDFDFAVDNILGGGPNQGIFLNGFAISGDSTGGDFSYETAITRSDIGGLLVPGLNTLYINATDLGGPSGLIFRATIETSPAAIPEPNILTLLGVGLIGWLSLGKRYQAGAGN